MILAIRTDTAEAWIELFDHGSDTPMHATRIELGRSMARNLLTYIERLLHKAEKNWPDLSGLVVFQGPGSFTGLRIGATIANTIAYAEGLPIVGTTGEQWAQDGVRQLRAGRNDKLVLPQYGREANITEQRR